MCGRKFNTKSDGFTVIVYTGCKIYDRIMNVAARQATSLPAYCDAERRCVVGTGENQDGFVRIY